jgi:hypothetical protein
MISTPISDANCFEPAAAGSMSRASSSNPGAYVPVAVCRELEIQLAAVKESYAVAASERLAAIASWDEERKRALREAARVVTANRLLDRAFGFVNSPLAGEISDYLTKTGAIKYL